MLRELHISNLAVIADARVELAAGLNCFTGATGAGKSLVIGAIEVLLGMRSPGEMLRPGVDEGRVSGVFDVRDAGVLQKIEQLTDAPIAADGGELLLVRRLYASGRSSVSLNGNPITLGMLKQVAEHLVDVHGQHDHQFLLKPANQIDVLDQFAALTDLRKRYHDVFAQVQEAKQRLRDLSANRTLREQQLELYRFQADEIDKAELSAGEYEELSARASVLRNLEKLTKEATVTYAALYEAEGSTLERLKMMVAVLSELGGLDQNLKPIADNMRDATIGLEEVAFDLSRYLDKLDLDPAEAAEVEDRLNTLNRVLNKYGRTVEDAMAHRAELARQIAELERATDDLSSLQKQIEPLTREVQKLGKELSDKRQAAAKKLSPQIVKELAELGMEKASFTVAFTPAPEATASGLDQVEFVARTNPGQLAQPLRKIASGGELSRIMLALKGILAQGDRVSVLVFDEIDANVGGRLGSIIGNKLRKLAAHHQVLCITHLPQIASYADRHLTVRKVVVDEKTQTSVRTMDGNERLQELAEMIGGQRITDTTRAQAKELLDAATAEFGKAPRQAAVPPALPPPPPAHPAPPPPPPPPPPQKRRAKARS
ncbi:MAG TPA: DNA repair protein RecN [Tepidisphaeraceae bacterium]|nr:DNA repair protein RecN [Tepidisphaeraceae bacterium]